MNGDARDLLATWPGRHRFPGVLIALALERDKADGESAAAEADPADLARDVLAHVGGVPPRTALDELLERGEYDAAGYLLGEWFGPRAQEVEALTRKLESAREGGVEAVRQRVGELERRAEAAGLPFTPPDAAVLLRQTRSRTASSAATLLAVEEDFGRRVTNLSAELDREITAQDRKARESASANRERFVVEQLRALLAAEELVAVRARLDREPLGTPIPEGMVPLPVWDAQWTPESLLECHLNRAVNKPPEFPDWKAADEGAKRVLTAFDRLGSEDSPRAAEDFANALGGFLGASGAGAVARRVDGGYFTFFDGLFTGEPLSRLHPTGRIDLYVGSPGTTAPPLLLASQAPHVAVGPDLRVATYTDRQPTAVLALVDLLRLVVLPDDRAASLLSVLAPQWPVDTLIGDGPEALGRILGDDPRMSWLTLRWITHLSLRGTAAMAHAMENCATLDPGLLRVLLRYAQDVDPGARRKELWTTRTGGWRKDVALVHALRDELLARCGSPDAQAGWWAALAACDPETGLVARQEIVDWVDICSPWDGAGTEVSAALETLVARKLLLPGAEDDLGVWLAGAVRALRPQAERELTVLLGRMEHAERPGGPAEGARPDDTGTAPDPRWTPWHRNRFRVIPDYDDYVRAEAGGEPAPELTRIAAAAERALAERTAEELAAGWSPSVTELAGALRALAGEWEAQYPGFRLDLRCPRSVPVAVPEAVVRTALYEVLDNAGEALRGHDAGVVQVAVTLDGPEVLVEVRDNGPGLSPEANGRRIFLSGWTTRGAGRGTGLHRVRQLLRAFSTPMVEAVVEVIDPAHLTLTGTAFRLVLPNGSGTTADR